MIGQDCRGRGYDAGCDSNPNFTEVRVTDAQGNTITSAYPGDIVNIEARVQGSVVPHCSNFYLMFYGRMSEYLDCYQDHVLWSETWWVSHPYAVPYNPGTTFNVGVLEVLTGVMLTTPLEVLVPVEEGEASFIWVTAPSEFTPNVAFNIDVTVRNIGGTDSIFSRIRNMDTSEILSERSIGIPGGGQHVFSHTIVLSQTTHFHCLIEIGHEENNIRTRTINIGKSINPISLITQGGY